MLYRIENATAYEDHTIQVTWHDGITATVDVKPVVSMGNVFLRLQDPRYFVAAMRVAPDKLGLEWPGNVDLSADGLRFRAFPAEASAEFEGQSLNEADLHAIAQAVQADEQLRSEMADWDCTVADGLPH